ncbi:hypothetical protein [Thalassospira sp.]|uniref:hypothetical protein n=1 Tax=Thalassospira sp. TaxID=1912094 RepID=UPI003AA86C9E
MFQVGFKNRYHAGDAIACPWKTIGISAALGKKNMIAPVGGPVFAIFPAGWDVSDQP